MVDKMLITRLIKTAILLMWKNTTHIMVVVELVQLNKDNNNKYMLNMAKVLLAMVMEVELGDMEL